MWFATSRLMFTFLLTLLFMAVLALSQQAISAQVENIFDSKQIGKFSFPTSGSVEAQAYFNQGVGYLHSFGWKQAREAFIKAQAIDPNFAMAYWGEAFSYNHPLLPNEWRPDAPATALDKLGSSSQERLSKAPTEREKGFIHAAEAYAYNKQGLEGKRKAWMQAMKHLYESFPEDPEVATFYAVSLLSAASVSGIQRNQINMLAGSIALDVYRKNDRHPGAVHYIIHAFDDPVHAPIALTAARSFAEIAPAVSHARHMPTHIFIQLGMWNEVINYNNSAFEVADQLWQFGDRPNDLIHSADWGQYGELQSGDIEGAEVWINKMALVRDNNPDSTRAKNTLQLMKSRLIVESQRWNIDDLMNATTSPELLALGIGATHLDRFDIAAMAKNNLYELMQQEPSNKSIAISYYELAGLIEFKTKNIDAGTALFNKGLAIASDQPPPRGAANPIKPIFELYGEVLLDSNKIQAAAEMFEEQLLLTPNRRLSVSGLKKARIKLRE